MAHRAPGITGRRRPRRLSRRERLRRTVLVTGLVVVMIVVLVVLTGGGGNGGGGRRAADTAARTGTRHRAGGPGATADATPTIPPGSAPAIESGVVSWQLPGPLSRASAFAPAGQGRVVVVGGLTGASSSTAAVTAVSVPGGATTAAGSLPTAGHDAASAVLGHRLLVFGGGDQSTVDTVVSLPVASSPGSTGSVIGRLPQPRSDAVAVVVDRTAYVLGGYDGTRADPEVLATTDGRTFSKVCALPVPVRYPAAAAVGHTVYLFGGQSVPTRGAGVPVTDIQAVDLATRTARVVGHLRQPLAGAAAVTLGGHVYLAGGDTSLVGGPGGTPTTSANVWAFDAVHDTMAAAGSLQVPVSHAAAAVVGSTAWLVGGETSGAPGASVQMLRPNAGFGVAGRPGAGSPYYGDRLLIADRGNDRLLLLNDTTKIVWQYPNPKAPPPPGFNGFYFPDDAFFVHHGTAIISNQEQNETIVELAFPSGKLLWSYGHPGQTGTAPGYLSEPDDAYLLKNGQVTVADANNCRVLVINPNGTVAHQIGTTGVCQHNPPTSMGSPNGDTPLADGNLLVSEINGSWVSEYTPTGHLVWTVQLPISYPSDPQQLGPDLYLIADYADPGAFLEFNRAGQVLYRYQPRSGPGMLNQPSLVERLPSGVFMANDDYNDRIVAIDPATGALVWQYGQTGQAGTAPGLLNTPDGFDILTPQGTTPTHPVTG